MTRSKRKASHARKSAQEPDFAKKKQRLGGRAKPSNLTSVSFKSRQVHVPVQGRAPTPSSKPGLTLPELLQRAGHYNVGTRLAAFNGLLRGVCDPRAAAHVQARLQLASVLAAALDSLCDDAPPVRRAARELSVACVGILRDVRPFARLLASTLNAALSHVRKDVRVDAARATTDVLGVPGVTPEAVFREGAGNPLVELKDLLGVVTGANGRVQALRAVAAVCGGAGVEGSSQQEEREKRRGGRVFYYQSRRKSGDLEQGVGRGGPELLLRMCASDAGQLVERVTYLGMECLPLAECRRDAGKCELLTATAVALRAVTCEHSLTDGAAAGLRRLLKKWGEEGRRGGGGRAVAEAERALAGSALALGEREVAGEYLLRVVGERGADVGEVEGLLRGYLNGSGGKMQERIALEWARKFAERGGAGDARWVERGAECLGEVLRGAGEEERGEMVESAARVGMGMAERGEWGAARRVVGIVARELRGKIGEGIRGRVGEFVAEAVGSGVGFGNKEVGRIVGACVFYGGVGKDERVLKGMAEAVGRGREGAEGVVAAVEAATQVNEGRGVAWLNAVAAVEAVEAVGVVRKKKSEG